LTRTGHRPRKTAWSRPATARSEIEQFSRCAPPAGGRIVVTVSRTAGRPDTAAKDTPTHPAMRTPGSSGIRPEAPPSRASDPVGATTRPRAAVGFRSRVYPPGEEG
jgi:hypothetical protein